MTRPKRQQLSVRGERIYLLQCQAHTSHIPAGFNWI